jgi:hypothetical protein
VNPLGSIVAPDRQQDNNKDFSSPTVQAVISDIMNQPTGLPE